MASYYLKDQLSINSRKLLADYLSDLILIADSLQSFRNALAGTPFFNGLDLFRFLDQDQKGYLCPKDFARLVSAQNKKLLHYAFGWFDVSKVGEITKTQFLQFVFPRSNPQLRQLITASLVAQHEGQQEKTSTIPLQTDLLQSLICQLMQKQTRLIPLRRILMDQDDYTLKAIMNCLDVDARGWVTTGDIYKFLKNYDIDVSIEQVCAVIGVYDCDFNGKINIRELRILVEGLENSDSQYRQIVRNSDRCAIRKLKNERCSCYKNTCKSAEKARSVSKKYHKKIQETQTAKKSNKENKYDERATFVQKILDRKLNIGKQEKLQKQEREKKQRIKSDKRPKYKQSQQIQVQRSRKKPKQEKASKQNKTHNLSLEELKYAFSVVERQTQNIDEDLKNIQQEMGARTELEMQRQLSNAHLKKKLKLQEQQAIRIQIQEMEIRKEEERIRRLKEQAYKAEKVLEQEISRNMALEQENQILRRINETKDQENEKLWLQQKELKNQHIEHLARIQKQNRQIMARELQYLELQKIREVESRMGTQQLKQLKEYEKQKIQQAKMAKQELQKQLQQKMYIANQMEKQHSIRRAQLEKQAYEMQVRAFQMNANQIDAHRIQSNARRLEAGSRVEAYLDAVETNIQANKIGKTEFDWKTQSKLRHLHDEERQRMLYTDMSQKQNQYFWRYRNYCQKLCSIVDPLGIKEHLAQTDEYLMKSKSIRNQIKKDRVYSVNGYPTSSKNRTKTNETPDTPDQKHKHIMDTLNKRTEQTKLCWSNN